MLITMYSLPLQTDTNWPDNPFFFFLFFFFEWGGGGVFCLFGNGSLLCSGFRWCGLEEIHHGGVLVMSAMMIFPLTHSRLALTRYWML